MGMKEVKRLLARKGIKEFETAFPDLFVYSPAFGADIKLQFTCGAREYILRDIELSAAFRDDEADSALAAYRNKLAARYGPATSAVQGADRIGLCWGRCEKTDGARLEAKTTEAAPDGMMRLVVTMGDDSLTAACGELRRGKINRWLNQWIVEARKYSTGMGLKAATAAYQKRYQDRLVVTEERDGERAEYPVMSLVAAEHDYFEGLDFEALFFEGEGPGIMRLKFTGDQAGKANPLNQRLYYSYFATTKFGAGLHPADMMEKLDLFIRAFGKPLETTNQEDRIFARWRQDAKEQSVTIENSGMIIVEQTDRALQEAYRDAAVQRFGDLDRTKFDQNLF